METPNPTGGSGAGKHRSGSDGDSQHSIVDGGQGTSTLPIPHQVPPLRGRLSAVVRPLWFPVPLSKGRGTPTGMDLVCCSEWGRQVTYGVTALWMGCPMDRLPMDRLPIDRLPMDRLPWPSTAFINLFPSVQSWVAKARRRRLYEVGTL